MRPRLMVRRPVRGLMLRNLDSEIMQADIRSPKSLDRILSGVDAVIHLGARASFEPYQRLYPSIVKGSINLMQAAIKAKVKNFVFGGSLLVYGDTIKAIDQTTGASPISGYGKAKLEAEQHLKGMAAKAGICFVSLRLPHVYGAHSLLFDQVRHGKVFFPGKGDNPFAHIHVHDAARALIHAAESDRPGIWVVADDLSCTWNEYFETVKTYYPRLRVTHISRLPVCKATLLDAVKLEPRFPTIHQGIPAVLDDSISFYWLPSNLDRL